MKNTNNKCKISLTGGIKDNGGILLLFLNVGAAPSSGHLLDRAKTVNLMKMPLWNIMYSVLSTVWIFLIYQGGQHQKSCAQITILPKFVTLFYDMVMTLLILSDVFA